MPDTDPAPPKIVRLDDRVGAIELRGLLEARRFRVTVERLHSGDALIEGNLAKGRGIIAFERKRLKDVLTSMESHRFAGEQLLKMIKDGHEVLYLVVESIHRENQDNGMLEEPHAGHWRPVTLGSRRFMRHDLDAHLTTLELLTPVHVRLTRDPSETVSFIDTVWRWSNGKLWDQHRSHVGFYTQPMTAGPLSLTKPSFLRHVASGIPGIGWEKSRDVERKFKNAIEFMLASEKELQEVPGVGPTIARRAVKAFAGEED